jgi:hypothetical protein
VILLQIGSPLLKKKHMRGCCKLGLSVVSLSNSQPRTLNYYYTRSGIVDVVQLIFVPNRRQLLKEGGMSTTSVLE